MKSSHTIYTAIITLALALATTTTATAQANGWDVFGVSRLEASVTLEDTPQPGSVSVTRLGIEYDSTGATSFRAEASLRFEFGASSLAARALAAGLALPSPLPLLPLGIDLHRAIALHQAYVAFSLGAFDGRFGIIHLPWGAGYVFNPTARALAPVFPGIDEAEAEGRVGLSLAAAVLPGIAVEAYALAEPRLRGAVPLLAELDPADFPLGLRAVARLDAVDISLSLSRSLLHAAAGAEWRLGLDATGFLGPFTLYGETAWRIFNQAAGVYTAIEPELDIDACAGLAVTIPVVELELRVEAAYLGGGASESAVYNRLLPVTGDCMTLARAYAFGMLEKAVDDRFKASVGVLVNLVDFSTAWLGQASWSPVQSFTFGLEALWFTGDEASEYGGRLSTGPTSWFDFFVPEIGISLAVAF